MATGEVRSRGILANSPPGHRAMPFIALPANGHGKDRESLLLAFRFTATTKTYGVSNVSEVLGADSGS